MRTVAERQAPGYPLAMASRTSSRTNQRRSTSYSTARRRPADDEARFSPRTLMAAAVGALLLLSVFFWYMLNGGWARMIDGVYDLTAKAGLRVEEVFITGRTNLDRDELLASIAVERGDPILALDLPEVHERVTANAWVYSARIERHLPNVLYIAVVERVPHARWQQAKKLRLVDAEGVVLSTQEADLQRFAALPLIVGEGAPKAAAAMLDTLRDYPELKANSEALVRVGDRRWDLRLSNGITIKLPDDNPAAALDRVQAVWQAADFVGKGVKVIDARLSDRLIVDNAGKGDDKDDSKKDTAKP